MEYVVVGGGTAGWLTALMVQRSFPDDQVAVIESDDLGILGAGEGTTPQIALALEYLGIHLSDLVKFADATIKHSIRFTNWAGDHDFYHHGFLGRNDIRFMLDTPSSGSFINALTDDSYIYQWKFKDPNEACNFTSFLGATHRVPFAEVSCDLSQVQDILQIYEKLSNHALHFNAVKLAQLLRQIAISRGVKHVEANVVNIETSPHGDITGLVTDSQGVIASDFVFDCSGFHRLIIGKHFNSKWRSFSSFLPADRAIGYFKPMQRPTPAYTEAVAMKNGWSWQIPLQSRWGAGYVYSSAHATEEEIRQEIIEREGDGVEWGKEFKFDPGYYEQSWINNCVAIGLSSGFLEPLEATSIMQSLLSLEYICSLKVPLLEASKNEKLRYSRRCSAITEEIAEFLYLHYLSDRADTEFWRQFTRTSPNMPDFIKEVVDICNHRFPTKDDFQKNSIFNAENFNVIIDGNGIIPKNKYEAFFANKRYDRSQEYLSMRRNIQLIGLRCVNHDQFLNTLR